MNGCRAVADVEREGFKIDIFYRIPGQWNGCLCQTHHLLYYILSECCTNNKN